MDAIEKNGKRYLVNECKTKWCVTIKDGKLELTYDVPKEMCPTYQDLCEFVSENEIF